MMPKTEPTIIPRGTPLEAAPNDCRDLSESVVESKGSRMGKGLPSGPMLLESYEELSGLIVMTAAIYREEAVDVLGRMISQELEDVEDVSLVVVSVSISGFVVGSVEVCLVDVIGGERDEEAKEPVDDRGL